MIYTLGQRVRLRLRATDPDTGMLGRVTNLQLVILNPRGVKTTYTVGNGITETAVTNPDGSPGFVYDAFLTFTIAKKWQRWWYGTGGLQGATEPTIMTVADSTVATI